MSLFNHSTSATWFLVNSPAEDHRQRSQKHSDALQLFAAEYAIKHDLNFFGICRGLQILNVSTGGTLNQHIPDHQKKFDHNNYKNRFTSHHLKQHTPHPAINTSLPVNCSHHQTIKTLGKNVEPLAHAQNGHIEAVHHTNTTSKIIAVQYHPEAETSRNTHLKQITEWFYNKQQQTAHDELLQREAA